MLAYTVKLQIVAQAFICQSGKIAPAYIWGRPLIMRKTFSLPHKTVHFKSLGRNLEIETVTNETFQFFQSAMKIKRHNLVKTL